jgi:hypothetical protein
MKLSKTQQEVVDLMREGWELAVSTTHNGGAWLQEDGVGRSGITKNISRSTYQALYRRNLLKRKGAACFPTKTYVLVKP